MRIIFKQTKRDDACEGGFTISELLAVGLIVGVLAALILPTLSGVRSSSQSVKCVRNLQSVFVATLAFIEDYDGKIPPPVGSTSRSVPNLAKEVHPKYSINAWWWSQAYVGQYTTPVPRSRYGRGKFSQEEVEIYNCPARHPDGEDSKFANENYPAVSYLMFRPEYIKGSPGPHALAQSFNYRAMQNLSAKPYLTEGRMHIMASNTAISGKIGETSDSLINARRLRRFHSNALNVLFYDGHVERFSGSDAEFRERFFN